MTILAVRHEAHEGLGFLERVFEEHHVSYQYLDLFDDPNLPLDLSGASGLVVLGGAMGVYETGRFPFLGREIELLRQALRQRLPTLGICLGSQLLAAAGGAKVYRGPDKEIGWFPVWTKSDAAQDPLLKHLPEETMAFHWHGDTFDLPPLARLLASSERYPNQAFRLGDNAWGLQFHLEITDAMIRDWVGKAEGKSKTASREWNACEILTQTPCFLPAMETLAWKVFGEFVSLCRGMVRRASTL